MNQIATPVKLDGSMETCFHVARAHNIGLTEATDPIMRALLRELAAHHVKGAMTSEFWLAAAKEFLPPAPVDHANLN